MNSYASSSRELKPTSARALVTRGLVIVVALFGGLTLWSVTLPLDSAVIAPSTLQVEGNRRTVQHLEGGIVRYIHVREGDPVEAGDALIEIDGTARRAELETIDARLYELRIRQHRLVAERDEQELNLPTISAEAPPGRNDVLRVEADLFDTRHARRDTEHSLLAEQIAQNETRIAGYTEQIASLNRQIALRQQELDGLRSLHERGYAPTHRLLAVEGDIEGLSGERAALTATRAETRSRIAEARLQLSRMDREFIEDVLSQLADIESELTTLAQRRIEVVDAVDRSIVRAPASGRVLGLRVHTLGGVVRPGDVVMDIVPERTRLIVAARIAPKDVDAVAIGQSVVVRFSALEGNSTPEIEGRLVEVSADVLTDENTGMPYYAALAVFDEEDVGAIGPLVPGMPAEAYIITGSQTAFRYLVKPLTDAWARTFREA